MLLKLLWLLINCIRKTIRRALCFRKPRRDSSSEDIPVLTTIGIVSNNDKTEEINVQEWVDWEESKANTVEEHIKMYRQQRANVRIQEKEDLPAVDYFLDMTPQITRQTKVLLKSGEERNKVNSTFSVAADTFYQNGAELGEWEESKTWEDEVDLSNALREEKKHQREKRLLAQQKKRDEKR